MKKYFIFFAVILAGAATVALQQNNDNPLNKGAVNGAMLKPTVFVDVRTGQEWEEGHLEGALHFELARLQQGELPDLDKNADIKIYCRSGRRAEEAKTILNNSGFTNVTNAGALADLQSEGKKICMGTAVKCN